LGRMSVIIVLGFIMIAGIIFIGINDSGRRSSAVTAEYACRIESRYSAETVVDNLITEYIRTGVTDTNVDYSNDHRKATGYIAPIKTGNHDSLIIAGQDSTYGETVKVRALVLGKNRVLNVEKVSPLSFDASNIDLGKLTGSIELNGWDEGIPNTSGVPGITVPTEDVKNQIEEDLKNITGDATVDGDGGQVAVEDGLTTDDIQNLFNNLKASADLVVNEMKGTSDFGTAYNPVVVYSDGDLDIKGNNEGYGVLVVNGSILGVGNLNWHGLIVSVFPEDYSGNPSLTLKGGGDSYNVEGGIIMSAADNFNVALDMKGNMSVVYNSDYLEVVQQLIEHKYNQMPDANPNIEKEVTGIKWSATHW